MKVVIDTSIIIDYLRGGIKWEEFIIGVDEDIELFLPTVVFFELFSGTSTKNPNKKQDMLDFVSKFYHIDLDEQISTKAGELFRDFTKNLEVPDYIIAASALSIGASVLTLNQKHFQQIPGLDLYLEGRF